MNYDVFGDLQDWGRVLDQIGEMRVDGTLEDHQPGLARVARYPFNWQLRQAALRAIARLKRPAGEVIRVAAQILLDENGDLETRTLAGNALSAALSDHGDDSARSEAVRSIQALLEKPEPPVLHMSARGWLESLCAATITTGSGGNPNASDRFGSPRR
jgi:hypothetical protein